MSFELRRFLVGAGLVCSLGLVPERAWAQKPEVVAPTQVAGPGIREEQSFYERAK